MQRGASPTASGATPARHDKRAGKRIALVLQGGGALGAYQAGVFQGLQEHGLTPDWVVGTSIGAVTAALIAGNPPTACLDRIRDFWDLVKHQDLFDMRRLPDAARRFNTWLSTLHAVVEGVPGFFTPRPFNPFANGLQVDSELASFYDTGGLAETLSRLVDFEYLQSSSAIRLTVNAMCVTTGELASFDSATQRIGVEHVMASSALPPGFPPVRIDGLLYWDGGLYSNTPIDIVLDDEPRVDTLCFMVDLWRAEGPEPRTFDEVQTRQKDVMFASRSRRHIEEYRRLHDLRNALHAMHLSLPQELRQVPKLQELAEAACDTTMHIVHLPYAGQDWHMAGKDINFSSGSLEWRWEQGYRDAGQAAEQAAWLAPQPPEIGVVVHELAPGRGSKHEQT
ncbi:MAG: patatin-like phospholipase family protein [Bacteroidota bacterium]